MAAAGPVPLVGCRTTPYRPVNADGTCGHRTGKRYRPKMTCTPTAVPTEAVEVAGRVRSVSVDVGDHVKVGQLQAEIEPVDLDERTDALDPHAQSAFDAIAQALGGGVRLL